MRFYANTQLWPFFSSAYKIYDRNGNSRGFGCGTRCESKYSYIVHFCSAHTHYLNGYEIFWCSILQQILQSSWTSSAHCIVYCIGNVADLNAYGHFDSLFWIILCKCVHILHVADSLHVHHSHMSFVFHSHFLSFFWWLTWCLFFFYTYKRT